MTVGPRQDLPPAGGFSEIRYKRHLPKRGFSGFTMLAGLSAMMLYGFVKVADGKREKREVDREKMWGRIYLTPFLQAEEDREMARRQKLALQQEKEIMRDVPGWEAGKSVFHGERRLQPRLKLG